MWLFAVQHNVGLWIERVPSEYNIADDPSREEYTALVEWGAVYVEPVLADELWHPQGWL